MRYLIFDRFSITFKRPTQFDKIFVEVDESGAIMREIGLDNNGDIIHAYPDRDLSVKFKDGKYGLFDVSLIQINGSKDDISKEQFENIWNSIS